MKPLRSSYPADTLLGGMAYTPSHKTDVRATFDRVRRQINGSGGVEGHADPTQRGTIPGGYLGLTESRNTGAGIKPGPLPPIKQERQMRE